MKVCDYSNVLNEVLSSANGRVVLINGCWGVGKTYFWEVFSEQYLNDRKKAYVSLFGKTNIGEIQSEALVQIFSRNKIIDKFSKITQVINTALKFGDKSSGNISFGVTGSSINLLLSLVKAKELKDVVVCLDDFERKSGCLKIEEVMGYASVLSERYSCKVILVMDESRICVEEKVLYEKYKEKVVDFEIKFTPDQSDVIESIVGELGTKYAKGVAEAIEFAGIDNLRIIKKGIHQLILLDKFLKIEISQRASLELAYNFTLLAYVYFRFGGDGLRLLSGPNPFDEDSLEDDDVEVKVVREKLQYKISNYSDLDNLLWNFFETMKVNEVELKNILDNSENTKEMEEVKEFVHSAFDKYTFDLGYQAEKFVEDVLEVLEKHKNKLVGIFQLDELVYVINSLAQVSGDKKFETFKANILQNYVLRRLEMVETLDGLKSVKKSSTIVAITKQDGVLSDIVERKLLDIEAKLIHGENIKQLLVKIPQRSAWGPEDEATLNSLSVDFIKKHIVTDPELFETVCDFVSWCNNNSGGMPFDGICQNVADAVVMLGAEELGAFRFERVRKILHLV